MSRPTIPTMGSYAFYVWGSYVLTIAAVVGEVLFLVRRRRALRHGREQA